MGTNKNRQSYQPETIIFNEGELGDCAFIVEKGEVCLSILVNGKPVLISTLHEGQIFGEMALLDDHLRCATAKTTQETDLLVIPRDNFQEKINSSDQFIRLMLNVTLERYREMRTRLNQTLRLNKVDEQDLLEQENKRQQAQVLSTAQQLEQENELRQALENKQFELYFQPIIALNIDKIIGCEALIRWNHPKKGLISPNQFITLSEQTGFIEPLGLWIIEQACLAFERFNNQLSGQLKFISINLSGRQFTPSVLIKNIKGIFAQHDVKPETIKFEITESILMENPLEAINILNEIKKMGSFIAIDDFGTGYSSFSYLHRFPIDSIKIDRSFTSTMQQNHKSYEIVKSLCALAKSLNIEIIAEGIEQVWEENSLKSLQADFGQGYLYAKPLTADAFIELNHSRMQ